MKILIFHGYLLRGTGSNIYNNNLARALAGLGHEVHLFCQDLEAEELPWVDSIGLWSGGARTGDIRAGSKSKRAPRQLRRPGSVTVYRPPIGNGAAGLRRGSVRRLRGAGLSAAQRRGGRELHLDQRGSAVRDVENADRRQRRGPGQPPADGTGGAGPGRGAPVRGQAPRLRPRVHGQAEPALRSVRGRRASSPAAAILVGSWHTAASLWEAIPGLDLESKTGLGPPGVDTDEFSPLPAERKPGDASWSSPRRSARARLRRASAATTRAPCRPSRNWRRPRVRG